MGRYLNLILIIMQIFIDVAGLLVGNCLVRRRFMILEKLHGHVACTTIFSVKPVITVTV